LCALVLIREIRVRFRVRDRVMVRVRMWIVWYMDSQTAARFSGRRGPDVACMLRVQACLHAAFAIIIRRNQVNVNS